MFIVLEFPILSTVIIDIITDISSELSWTRFWATWSQLEFNPAFSRRLA